MSSHVFRELHVDSALALSMYILMTLLSQNFLLYRIQHAVPFPFTAVLILSCCLDYNFPRISLTYGPHSFAPFHTFRSP